MPFKALFLSIIIIAVGCGKEEERKGDVYFNAGKFKKAITAYNEFLKLNPRDIESLYNRGRSYEELGQFEVAFNDFKTVLEIDRKNTTAYLSLSKYHYRKGNYKQALYESQKAIELILNYVY